MGKWLVWLLLVSCLVGVAAAQSLSDVAKATATPVGNSKGSILLLENTCEVMSPYCYQTYQVCNLEKEAFNLYDSFKIFIRSADRVGSFTELVSSKVSLAKGTVNNFRVYELVNTTGLVEVDVMNEKEIDHYDCKNKSGKGTDCVFSYSERRMVSEKEFVLKTYQTQKEIDKAKYVLEAGDCSDIRIGAYVFGKVDLVVEYKGYKAVDYAIWEQFRKGWTMSASTNGIDVPNEWNIGGWAQGRRSGTLVHNFGFFKFDNINASGTVASCELRNHIQLENGDDTHDIWLYEARNSSSITVANCGGGGSTCANITLGYQPTDFANQLLAGNYTGTISGAGGWVNFSLSVDYCQKVVNYMSAANNATLVNANKGLLARAPSDDFDAANSFVQIDDAIIVITFLDPSGNGTSVEGLKNLSVTNVSAVINWSSFNEVNGTVYWGVGGYGNVTGHNSLSTNHSVVLNNLNSDTTYIFRAESCVEKPLRNCSIANSSFTTQKNYTKPANSSVVIVGKSAFGDTFFKSLIGADTNYASETLIEAGAHGFGSGGVATGLYKVDLSSVTNRNYSSVYLNIFVRYSSSVGALFPTLNVIDVCNPDSWAVNTVTYNTKPSICNGTVVGNVSFNVVGGFVNQLVSINLTDYFLMKGNATNVSFEVTKSGVDAGNSYLDWGSSRNGNDTLIPYINFTSYAPDYVEDFAWSVADNITYMLAGSKNFSAIMFVSAANVTFYLRNISFGGQIINFSSYNFSSSLILNYTTPNLIVGRYILYYNVSRAGIVNKSSEKRIYVVDFMPSVRWEGNIEVGASLHPFVNASFVERYGGSGLEDNSGYLVDYLWRFYNGSAIYSNGSEQNKSSGLGLWLDTLNSSVLKAGQEWTLSVMALRADLNSTWVNVSATIFNVSLDNCSVFGNVSLGFTIFEEDSPFTGLVADFEAEGSYWLSDPSLARNFSFKSNNSDSYRICISQQNVSLSLDLYVKYASALTHRYYLYNKSINASVFNVSLYNFGDSTGLSLLALTMRYKSNYLVFGDVVGKLERKYIGEGVWRTVQMGLSSSLGNMYFDVKERTTDYRLIFYDKSNRVLEVSDNLKFSCLSGLCDVTYLISPYNVLTTGADVAVIYKYDNLTGSLNINFSDNSGKSQRITTLVTKVRGGLREEVCELNSNDLVGNYSCGVGVGKDSYSAVTYSVVDGVWTPVEAFTFNSVLGGFGVELDSKDGAFYSFGLSAVLITLGFFNPMLALIMMVVSAIVVVSFGMVAFVNGWAVVVALALLALFVSMRVRQY